MNMKMNKKLMLAATVVIMLNFSGCGKYEDGPFFSLRPKKARLVGEWEVVEINKEKPDEGSKIIMEFEKDGDFSLSYFYSSYSESYLGEWEWEDNKKTVEIEVDGEKSELEILRLTNDELWFEDENNNEWQLEKD